MVLDIHARHDHGSLETNARANDHVGSNHNVGPNHTVLADFRGWVDEIVASDLTFLDWRKRFR